MSDASAVILALAAAAGALTARPFPLALAALVVAAAFAARRPVLLWVGVAVAASALAARSWAGLEPPVAGPVSGWATLVSDPADAIGATRVEVRLGHRRLEAFARGGAAGQLRMRLAGERVQVSGYVSPLSPVQRTRLAPRHVSGSLTVERVGAWEPGNAATGMANRIRHTLLGGAESMPHDQRTLFAGFVLGDDRGQPPEVAFDFRESGLSHLLVVSGQNVAFVLALAAPLLRRLDLTARLAAGVGVLFLFGTLTRWEPSVLRAVAMAFVTLLAASIGRPASTLRVLSLAVAGLILVDPLLVHSVGFRLSVGACTGIALLARPLSRAVPGPRPIVEALAVTVAAQAGVAPVFVTLFGGIPVSTLAANLLALPAAGPITVWGIAAEFPAGLLGGAAATLLHLPTRLLLWWVAAVARWSAALPLGRLGAGHVVALALIGALGFVACSQGLSRWAAGAVAAGAGVLLLPAVGVARPSPLHARTLAPGAELWRAGASTVVVLDGARAAPDRLLSAVRGEGVAAIDVLVVSRPGANEARLAAALRLRFPIRLVLAPPGSQAEGARVPPPGSDVRAGPLSVHVEHDNGRLVTTVSRADRTDAVGSRGPPG